MSNVESLIKKLKAFRLRIRLWYFVTGICYLSAVTTLLVFISLFLDRIFRFDWSQRLICLIVGILILLLTFYRHILKPLLSELSDEYLCLAIEKRKPELGQLITTGYQLSTIDQPEVYGYSSGFVSSTIESCINAINSLAIKELLDHRLKRKNYLGGFVSLVLLYCFMSFFTNDFRIWYERNIFLNNVKWPRKTVLMIKNEIKNKSIYVPAGDSFDLMVEADVKGVIPQQLELKMTRKFQDSYLYTSLIGVNEYQFHIEKVDSDFSFIVYGGDDEIDSISVKTIQKPEINQIKFILSPCSYTGLPDIELSSDMSTWSILEGSQLKVLGSVNKNIASVELFRNNIIVPIKVNKIINNQFEFIMTSEVIKSGSYEIRVYDENRITKDPGLIFSLNVLSDKLPEAISKFEYYSDVITNNAVFKLHWSAKDDFGVKFANLNLVQLGKDESATPIKNIDLFKTDERTKKDIQEKMLISLKEYSLIENNQILMYVEVSDFLERKPLLNARSGTIRLNIVSNNDFEKYIFDKEQELSIELDRLLKEEEALQVISASLLDVTRKNKLFSHEEIKELVNSDKKQKLMEQRNLKVMIRLDQIINDISANNLDANNTKERLEDKVKKYLKEINEELIPLALLHSAEVKNANKIDKNISALQSLLKVQSDIVHRYTEIIKSMKKWEGYYETVGLLKEILSEQKKLKEKTENRKKESIKGVFDE